jgi:PAS domain S-box-containing protein
VQEAYVRLDGEFRFTFVNRAAEGFLGALRADLIGKTLWDVHPETAGTPLELGFRRALAERTPMMFESYYQTAQRWYGLTVTPDANGGLIVHFSDITERRRAEEQYKDIFEGALEGISRVSPQGQYLAVNPALAKMLGFDSPEQMKSFRTDLAKQVWLDPNERSRFLELLEKRGVVRDYECRYVRKDGTVFWVSLNSRKVCGPDGNTLYYDDFMEDITDRNRMEDALRKSEEKFSKAFHSSPAAVLIADLTEDRFIDVNEAFERITGYRRDEAIGRTSSELGMWSDPHDRENAIGQLRVDGRIRNLEYRFRSKTGAMGIGLISAELIELAGKPCALATTIDITERKQIEQRLTTLGTAIEQAGEQIVITDLDGVIQYCNPAFEKITGYSKDEAIGANPRILKSGKHTAEFYGQLWATIKNGGIWTGHLFNKKKDGSLYEEDATISPIRDASGKITGFVAVKRDVTQHIQLERQFQQAQKLESIGRLAGGVAHDFNNILTIINGYSDFLITALDRTDPLWSSADEIRKAAERAASLTKQLLAFSRKQVIEPKILDVNTTIRDSEQMLQRLLGEDIMLATRLDPFLGQVMADPEQVHQVIMNLAVNARDAMPDGGKLDISTANVEVALDDDAITQPDAKAGRYVMITVTDGGTGMDENTRQHIFEPFFTTKGRDKGTGLGLSTVYGIVRQSDGWMDVSSELGVGTSFKLYFPRIDGRLVEEQRQATRSPELDGGETILVVEDQDAVRRITKSILKVYGYDILEAANGDEAMDVARKHPGDIHLLLTDVVLPGINGRELSERLRTLRPKLKVLFTSGYTSEIIVGRGVLDSGLAYIAKPFIPDRLAAKVREVLTEPSQ